MHLRPIDGLSLLIVVASAVSAAAADSKRAAKAPVAAAVQPAEGDQATAGGPRFLSEFRFGFSAQDPWGRESRPGGFSGEMLFAKPFEPADLFASYFVPRPHIGGSASAGGRTSSAYAGLTWSIDVVPRVFVEASLGGALHDQSSNPFEAALRGQGSSCSPLFREAGAVGIRLSRNWSVMALVEHMSNGGGCADSRGLTNFGARLGYSF
jgi:lipid A 3-O-deacylase